MAHSNDPHPKVSVIIPTYNCVKYLPEALDSVLAQTYQDFEIIIIDDGSLDGTRSLVEEYLQKYPGIIRYIYQENRGLACARNTAMKNSRGEYIALLDADDVFLSERIRLGVEVLDQTAGVGLCHANITRMDEGGRIIRTPLRDEKFLSGYVFENILLKKANVSVPTIIFRRSCIEKIGGFDENLTRLGCEDREFCLRLSREYKFYYIDKVLAYYRERSNSMSRDLFKMLKARYYVVNKHTSECGFDVFIRKKAFAAVHREMGDTFLFDGLFFLAAGQYIKSIVYWPFGLWTWINLAKAIFRFRPNTESTIKPC